MLLLPAEADWMKQAACPKSGLSDREFFPEKGDSKFAAEGAKAVCGMCPVQEACLNYALTEGIAHGIWGGMVPKERTAERRRRDLTARYERIRH